MKKSCRVLSAALALAMVLSLNISASNVQIGNELDGAIYIADQLENGAEKVSLVVPQGLDFTLMYEYTRMLYPGYYGISWRTLGSSADIVINFDSVEKNMAAERKAQELVSQLVTRDMTQMEKITAFHDYLVNNCVYDTHAAMNVNTASPDSFCAYGALVLQKAVCDGYSHAFYLLCKYAGIPCMYIASEEMNHSWNAILYGDQVLYVDVTFDDGYTSGTSPSHEFFMLTAEEMTAKEHSWPKDTADKMINTVWTEEYKAANSLYQLGLFRGSDKGFELSRSPYRSETAVMISRLLGEEQQALAADASFLPFTDVSEFYKPYVAYLYDKGLVKGMSETEYMPTSYTTAAQYMTFMLRVLGYDDSAGDFQWSKSLETAVQLGIITEQDRVSISSVAFDRGAMAYLSMKNTGSRHQGGDRLCDELVRLGVISQQKLKEIIK